MVQRAWGYIAGHYRSDWKSCMAKDGCWEFVTFLNYVAVLLSGRILERRRAHPGRTEGDARLPLPALESSTRPT